MPHAQQKVTEDQVEQFITSARVSGRTVNEMAQHFNVQPATVRKYTDRLLEAGKIEKGGERRKEKGVGRPSDVFKMKN